MLLRLHYVQNNYTIEYYSYFYNIFNKNRIRTSQFLVLLSNFPWRHYFFAFLHIYWKIEKCVSYQKDNLTFDKLKLQVQISLCHPGPVSVFKNSALLYSFIRVIFTTLIANLTISWEIKVKNMNKRWKLYHFITL